MIDAVGRGWYFTIFSLLVGVGSIGSAYEAKQREMSWRLRDRCHNQEDPPDNRVSAQR